LPNTVSTRAIADKVRQQVSRKRWEHILRVAELAGEIAKANGLDPQKAYLAGLLHDVARELPEEELVRLCPPQNEVERSHPRSLHGCAGRKIADGWGVDDPEILDAVEGHVWGVSRGNLLGMAVYVADSSEPGRRVNERIRELALAGRLREAYAQAVAKKVEYLRAKGIPIHPRTLKSYAETQA